MSERSPSAETSTPFASARTEPGGDYPPRFTLAGRVLNVFQRPAGVSREGQAYGGDWIVQLLSADHLRNGETKLIPTDVSFGSEEAEARRHKVGSDVRLPVTVYARNGNVVVSLARGTTT